MDAQRPSLSGGADLELSKMDDEQVDLAPEHRTYVLEALRAKFLEGKAKAKQHLDAAVRAKTAGDFVAAAEAYKRALAISPSDPEIKAGYDDMMRAATAKLSESYRRQALLEERYGH